MLARGSDRFAPENLNEEKQREGENRKSPRKEKKAFSPSVQAKTTKAFSVGAALVNELCPLDVAQQSLLSLLGKTNSSKNKRTEGEEKFRAFFKDKPLLFSLFGGGEKALRGQ